MRFLPSLLSFAMILPCVGRCVAQEEPPHPTPSEEHHWLEKFVGQWETEATGTMGPDQPPVTMKGTMEATMLGGFWLVNEMEGNVMDMKFRGIQTIGYDPEKKQYVGTWVDSMTNHLWKYRGSVDETGRILTLEAEGPNPMTGETASFRDVYEFKSADHIVAKSEMQDESGEWITFMTGDSRRKK